MGAPLALIANPACGCRDSTKRSAQLRVSGRRSHEFKLATDPDAATAEGRTGTPASRISLFPWWLFGVHPQLRGLLRGLVWDRMPPDKPQPMLCSVLLSQM